MDATRAAATLPMIPSNTISIESFSISSHEVAIRHSGSLSSRVIVNFTGATFVPSGEAIVATALIVSGSGVEASRGPSNEFGIGDPVERRLCQTSPLSTPTISTHLQEPNKNWSDLYREGFRVLISPQIFTVLIPCFQPVPLHMVTRNVVIAGETGVGKSALINLISGQNLAEERNDVVGVTATPEKHDIAIDDEIFRFWDTPGFNEGSAGTVSRKKAKKIMRSLFDELEEADGVHLLVFCFRCTTRILASLQQVYNEVCSAIPKACRFPMVAVVTYCDCIKGSAQEWWNTVTRQLEEKGMKFSGYACVTMLTDKDNPPMQGRSSQCQKAVQNLILSHSLYPKFSPTLNLELFGKSDSNSLSSMINESSGSLNSLAPIVSDVTNNLERCQIDPIGGGALGSVWACKLKIESKTINSRPTDRGKVAVKAFRLWAKADDVPESFQKALGSALEGWVQLIHPNIVTLMGITSGFVVPYPCVVSEWMHEGTLESYLRKRGEQFSVLHRLQILEGVASGMIYLHSQGVVHGNLNAVLSGKPPWHKKTVGEIMHNLKLRKNPDLPLFTGTPGPLLKLIERCWSPGFPSQRPSAQEVLSIITQAESNLDGKKNRVQQLGVASGDLPDLTDRLDQVGAQHISPAAQVYSCILKHNGGESEKVAVKVFRSAVGADPADTEVKAFEHELRAWRSLSHDNVVLLLGVATAFKGPFLSLVSQWMPKTLRSFMSQNDGELKVIDRLRLVRSFDFLVTAYSPENSQAGGDCIWSGARFID
ncbi:hypothetical protein HYDPIDRAFT_166101 [Hydnomerulius pinastri MD-312]|nr:hypothetical protein HYDPIDRAFT_166101 [Hydnomerulius pinastri MD-312]